MGEMHRWLMNAVGKPLSRETREVEAPRKGEVVVALAGLVPDIAESHV